MTLATIAQAIREAAQRLEATSDTARLDAEVLMAHALGVSRSDLLLRHMRDEALASFATLVERRAGQEPVAYITGHQEFYGRDFLVTPDVLIPRGDSETIVEAALSACVAPARVLDCGVGSGALLLSVLAERPEAEGVGIDRSAGALAVAAANAERLGLSHRARMEQRDWTQPGWAEAMGRFDCILANPPYVESEAELAPSVREFEPSGALFAGPDGLDDYHVLVPQLPKLLSRDGIAVLEIGWTQAEAVRQMAESAGFSATVHNDLAGRARALLLRFCAWQCLA
ncbi:MAG: protein-(glutamine-N5) methyltransferase, release factor-specific [Sphingomonadales bacterium 63-6]|nr:MAG: protein-(glutamine-N5) methyltransferase, release factor-specific [Sphingomonadales bacterium 63-6]